MYSISQSALRFTSFLLILLTFAFSAAAVADDDYSHLLAQQVVIDLSQLQEETSQSDMPERLLTRLNKRLDRVKREVEAGVRTTLLGWEDKALPHFLRAHIHINHYQAILYDR
jgi:hypothetical protein